MIQPWQLLHYRHLHLTTSPPYHKSTWPHQHSGGACGDGQRAAGSAESAAGTDRHLSHTPDSDQDERQAFPAGLRLTRALPLRTDLVTTKSPQMAHPYAICPRPIQSESMALCYSTYSASFLGVRSVEENRSQMQSKSSKYPQEPHKQECLPSLRLIRLVLISQRLPVRSDCALVNL